MYHFLNHIVCKYLVHIITKETDFKMRNDVSHLNLAFHTMLRTPHISPANSIGVCAV